LVSISLEIPTDKGTDAAIQNNIGVELSNAGKLDAAVAHYDEAIRLNPRLSEAHNNRANAYVRLGRLDDAVIAYREAVTLAPHSSLFHYNLGSALLDKGDFEAAVEQLRTALSLGPSHANTYLNLGLALSGLERNSEALNAYDQAARLDPTNISALSGRGLSLSKLGKFEEALQAQQEAVEALRESGRADDPAYIQIYQHLAEVLANLGRWNEARDVIEEWERRAPNDAAVHYARGVVSDNLDQYEQATQAYKIAVRLMPDFPQALGGLGTDLVRLGQPEAAIGPLEQAIQLDPDNGSLRFNLGLVHKTMNRFADAAQSFQEAVQLGMETVDAYAELGYSRLQMGNLDGALAAYAKAEERDSHDPIIPQNMGLIFASVGRFQEAIASFRRALELDPNLKLARTALCKALIDTDDLAAAATELHKIPRIQRPDVRNTESIDTFAASPQSEAVDGLHEEGDLNSTDSEINVTIPFPPEPTRLAADLFQRQRDTTAPVNVAAIASAANVRIFLANFQDNHRTASQLLRLRGEQHQILLASELQIPWRRVFLAQQLYYALAHRLEPDSADTLPSHLAERFAAELLTPRNLVTHYWPTIRNVDAMAAAFDVPRSVMNGRLAELGLDQGSLAHEHPERSTGSSAAREGSSGHRPGHLAPE
jgi:tetratricopeptide (TPR) repeat protein